MSLDDLYILSGDTAVVDPGVGDCSKEVSTTLSPYVLPNAFKAPEYTKEF